MITTIPPPPMQITSPSPGRLSLKGHLNSSLQLTQTANKCLLMAPSTSQLSFVSQTAIVLPVHLINNFTKHFTPRHPLSKSNHLDANGRALQPAGNEVAKEIS